jgi:hypothetical protein
VVGGLAGADFAGGGAGVVAAGGAVVVTMLVVAVVAGAVVGVGGADVVLTGAGRVGSVVLVADLEAPQAVISTSTATTNVWRTTARTASCPAPRVRWLCAGPRTGDGSGGRRAPAVQT